MHELGERGRGLVGEARAALQPTAADRARVRAALAARLGPPTPPKAQGGANAAPALQGLPFGAKVGVGIAALALLAGSLLPARSAQHAVGPDAPGSAMAVAAETAIAPAVEAPAASATPGSGSAGVDTPSDVPEPSPRAARSDVLASARPVASAGASAAPSSEASTTPRASSLQEETALMREAERALASGNAKGSLAKLDELSGRFENGVLKEERLAARVLALCAAGDQVKARAEAEQFLRTSPNSPHAGRVRASCAFARPSDAR